MLRSHRRAAAVAVGYSLIVLTSARRRLFLCRFPARGRFTRRRGATSRFMSSESTALHPNWWGLASSPSLPLMSARVTGMPPFATPSSRANIPSPPPDQHSPPLLGVGSSGTPGPNHAVALSCRRQPTNGKTSAAKLDCVRRPGIRAQRRGSPRASSPGSTQAQNGTLGLGSTLNGRGDQRRSDELRNGTAPARRPPPQACGINTSFVALR